MIEFLVETATLSDEDDTNDPDDPNDTLYTRKERSGKKSEKRMIFTPRMLAALDRCQVTNRQAMHIISSVALALGHSLDEIILNRNSLIKYRKENRKQIAEEVQNSYKVRKYDRVSNRRQTNYLI